MSESAPELPAPGTHGKGWEKIPELGLGAEKDERPLGGGGEPGSWWSVSPAGWWKKAPLWALVPAICPRNSVFRAFK